jgi:hypothetical protein
MPSPNTTINDQVVKFENLLESMAVLHQTIQDEAQKTLSDDNLVRIVALAISNEEFRTSFIQGVVSRIGTNRLATEIVKICNTELMARFESKLDQVLTRENLQASIANYSMNNENSQPNPAPLFQIERPIEELKTDNVDDVKELCRRLAGDDAWSA